MFIQILCACLNAIVAFASHVPITLGFESGKCSLPPLHNLGAHVDETSFRFALGEEGDCVDGFVDVILC